MATISLVQGLQHGFFLNRIKAVEDRAYAGKNAFITALLQMMQEKYTLFVADTAMNVGGFGSVPRMARGAVYLTPPLLAWISGKEIENQAVRSTVTFLQAHVGTFCHVATLISSIALIYFGQVTLGISTCSILGLGFLNRSQSLPQKAHQKIHTLFHVAALVSSIALIYLGHLVLGIPSCFVLGAGLLDRNGILPQKMRQWIHVLTPPLTLAPSLFAKGFAERALCILFLVGYCMQQYLDRQKEPQEISIPSPNALTLENITSILMSPSLFSALQVRHNYVHIPCSPSGDLRMKFLSCLQEYREQWMRESVQTSVEEMPFASGVVTDEVFNEIVQLTGMDIKLGLKKRDLNSMATDPLLRFACIFLGEEGLKAFWEEHTPTDLTSFLHRKIGSQELPKDEVVAWWKEWVNRQNEGVQQQFKNGNLFGEPFEINGKIRPIFILLMLFQMGILEFDPTFNPLQFCRHIPIAPQEHSLMS